jgi:hypothetical protein
MGKPLLLFGQPNLLNHSFEADADEADPSSWTISGSSNGTNDVDTAEFHSAGIGFPSIKSLRQNVTGANITYVALAAQRVQCDDLLAILKARDLEIAVAVMVKYGQPQAQNSVHLELKQYDGSNLVVGEGTEKTPPTTRSFMVGEGPEWFMLVTVQKLHADTDRIEVHLRYQLVDVADYHADADVWWDRVFLGGFIDFHKGFKEFSVKGVSGYGLNQGDGVAEIVKFARSSSLVQLSSINIVENSVLDNALKGFLQSMASDTPGRVALWADRDRFTNGERHFQFLVPDPKTPDISYPKGWTRRNYTVKLIAYTEFTD